MDLEITPDQEHSWRTKGFVVIDGFDVSGARSEAQFSAAKGANNPGGFGSKAGAFQVPCGSDSIDLLPFRLHSVAQKLLRSDRVLLSQADVWIKYPQKDRTQLSNDDQRMHCDFGNNTLFPTAWQCPNAMAAIIYLDSSSSSNASGGVEGGDCEGGGTAAVPRRGDDDPDYALDKMVIQPGYGNRPWFNDKATAERWFDEKAPAEAEFRRKLYEREVIVTPTVGRVLLYRLDLWHRGTPLTKGSRRVMNLVYLLQSDPGHAGRWAPGFWKSSYWWTNGKYGVPERMFSVLLSPEKRTALGFPPVDSTWWSEEKLRLVKLRFPEFDVEPYKRAAIERTRRFARKNKFSKL